jgi:hypothetical protein
MRPLLLVLAAAVLSGCNSLNPKHGAMCVHFDGYGAKATVVVYGEAKPASAANTPQCAVAISNEPIAPSPAQAARPTNLELFQ